LRDLINETVFFGLLFTWRADYGHFRSPQAHENSSPEGSSVPLMVCGRASVMKNETRGTSIHISIFTGVPSAPLWLWMLLVFSMPLVFQN
jgi:hypothetical protein